jgi:hypothetical protein
MVAKGQNMAEICFALEIKNREFNKSKKHFPILLDHSQIFDAANQTF